MKLRLKKNFFNYLIQCTISNELLLQNPTDKKAYGRKFIYYRRYPLITQTMIHYGVEII